MEMEMEMRATEDIDISTDITPPLTPLSFSLFSSHIHTHCSNCFSLLPSSSSNPINSLLYCSPSCSLAHSPLLSPHHSLDLRTALRLLLRHRPTPSGRVAGLLSNRNKLTCQNDQVSERIRVDAEALASAIADHRGDMGLNDDVLEEATVALCAVLTNAVEVQDNEGHTLGMAAFDPTFSWINHSCSPNACYRFTLSSPSSSSSHSSESKLRIAPFARNSQQSQVLHLLPHQIFLLSIASLLC